MATGRRTAPQRRGVALGATVRLPRQSEASWQATVVEYATMRGYRAWHDRATNAPRRCGACGEVRRGPRNDPGFLDLILIRRPRLIWVELKAEDGIVSDDQQWWIDELRACGQEVYVFKPSDWDELVRVLR